jgi:hypothetical protein
MGQFYDSHGRRRPDFQKKVAQMRAKAHGMAAGSMRRAADNLLRADPAGCDPVMGVGCRRIPAVRFENG